jgi:hypothetical protein
LLNGGVVVLNFVAVLRCTEIDSYDFDFTRVVFIGEQITTVEISMVDTGAVHFPHCIVYYMPVGSLEPTFIYSVVYRHCIRDFIHSNYSQLI